MALPPIRTRTKFGMDDKTSELLVLGSVDAGEHLSAIERNPRLGLVTHIEDPTAETEPAAEPAAQRGNGPSPHRADGWVICTPCDERSYWLERALDANKPVLLATPLLASQRTLAMLRRSPHSARVAVASRLLASDVALHMASVSESRELGRCVYVDMNLEIPRHETEAMGCGVTPMGASELLILAERWFGSLDSIHARTRSFVCNRPNEDTVSALLRFVNGVEGVLQVRALDADDGLSVSVFGTAGSAKFLETLAARNAVLMDRHYANLAAVLAGNERALFGADEIARGAFLSNWLEHSAREDREMYRSDVRKLAKKP